MNNNDHDAPVIHLLSIKKNPLVVNMTPAELQTLVSKLRHSNLPPAPKPLSKAAQYQALLDTL
jgi:hypothetical protein